MDKKYVITFSISVIVMFTLGIVMLMIMIPQQDVIIGTDVKEYSEIIKTDFTFSNSKNISKESLVQKYDVNSENIQKLQNQKQYKPGNADPFTPKDDLKDETNNDTSKEDTTNKNGGKENPPATTK